MIIAVPREAGLISAGWAEYEQVWPGAVCTRLCTWGVPMQVGFLLPVLRLDDRELGLRVKVEPPVFAFVCVRARACACTRVHARRGSNPNVASAFSTGHSPSRT